MRFQAGVVGDVDTNRKERLDKLHDTNVVIDIEGSPWIKVDQDVQITSSPTLTSRRRSEQSSPDNALTAQFRLVSA